MRVSGKVIFSRAYEYDRNLIIGTGKCDVSCFHFDPSIYYAEEKINIYRFEELVSGELYFEWVTEIKKILSTKKICNLLENTYSSYDVIAEVVDKKVDSLLIDTEGFSAIRLAPEKDIAGFNKGDYIQFKGNLSLDYMEKK